MIFPPKSSFINPITSLFFAFGNGLSNSQHLLIQHLLQYLYHFLTAILLPHVHLRATVEEAASLTQCQPLGLTIKRRQSKGRRSLVTRLGAKACLCT